MLFQLAGGLRHQAQLLQDEQRVVVDLFFHKAVARKMENIGPVKVNLISRWRHGSGQESTQASTMSSQAVDASAGIGPADNHRICFRQSVFHLPVGQTSGHFL